jgi:hypothetical protein
MPFGFFIDFIPYIPFIIAPKFTIKNPRGQSIRLAITHASIQKPINLPRIAFTLS